MSDTDIRAAIRRELRADGATQNDLARYVGVSQGHVSMILAGVTDSPGVLRAMAEAVGLSVVIPA